jgi:hypothetical protein
LEPQHCKKAKNPPVLVAEECSQDMRLPELFSHRLSFQSFHIEIICLGRHDEKHHHCDTAFMHLKLKNTTESAIKMKTMVAHGP